ncbi:MAG: tetratricopeptide repeat protein [Candidatus Omnitrophota bacterium]
MLKANSNSFRITVLALLILTAAWLYPVQPGFTQNNPAEQFRTAAKAFSDAFYDAALSLFERFVKEFPDNQLIWEAKLYLGKCYYYKQDYQKALKVFSEIVEQPKALNLAPEACYWLGSVYLKGKDFSRAADYAEKILKNYPDSEFKWPGYYLLGQSLKESGNLPKASAAFLDVINSSADPAMVEAAYLELFKICLSEKNYLKLISLSETYLKKYSRKPSAAKVYFYLGEAYYAQNNWNKAQESYQKALSANPNPELIDLVYQGLGFTYIEKGSGLEAKIAIDKIRDKELRLSSQGDYYFKIKDYLQALETFNMFVRDYPQSRLLAGAYLNKADILYELGRLNDAVYAYKYVLDNFPDSEDIEAINKAHYGLAWSYLKSGKFKEAIDEFKNTLEYASNPVVKVSSQIHIADAYQETGRYQEALDMYSLVLKDDPNTIYADYIQFQIGLTFLKKKDLEKAFLALRNLQNNFPSSKLTPQAQYYLAVGYFSSGDYAQAKSLLEDFIAKFPQDDLVAKARYLYGKCFFNEKDYLKALTVFKQVIGKINDRQIEELAYVDIGTTYLNLSQFENAKKIWASFLKKYPQSPYRASVALYLGGLYEKEKNFSDAQKYYRQVAADYKDTLWGYEAVLALGHLYWDSGDLEKAEQYFETLTKKSTPLTSKSKLYLARILAQRQNYDAALKLYDELAAEAQPIAGVANLEKALIFKQRGQYPEAAAMFRQAIALGVDSQELRFSFGICLEKTAETKEAVEQYFKVIYNFGVEDPKGMTAEDKDYKTKSFFRIAKIYERENNLGEAKKIYQKIIALGVSESKVAEARLKELGVK